MFKLFIYSFVWRASVCTHPVFNNFKLIDSDEEALRILLDKFIQDTEADTTAYCQEYAAEFIYLPLSIVTTEIASNATANFVQPFQLSDGKILIFANEFIIVLYLDWNPPHQGEATYNFGNSLINFVIMTIDEWSDYQKIMVKFIVESTYNNFNKMINKNSNRFDIKGLGL